MAIGIIARKIGMTQIFSEKGEVLPVTILKAGPCFVTQVKTEAKDSYNAIQLGFEEVRSSTVTRARLGHLQKNGLNPLRILKEFRDPGSDFTPGQEIKIDIFSAGTKIKVTSISKGKGFQGVMKRHGFGGGRMTHGSKFHKAPGSLGASTYPGRVFKGKRMPGHAGSKVTTTKNLEIVHIDSDNNLMMVRGSVPGPRTAIVKVEVM